MRKVIFSRKGVDSRAGRCASPIIDGRPISLPIPTTNPTRLVTRYSDIGLGEHIERATKGRLSGDAFCHEDPMFDGRGNCGFGQVGAAQSHLENQGVGVGDLFLFFGLFSEPNGKDKHHRIFGYLEIGAVAKLGEAPSANMSPPLLPRLHPHVIGAWKANNTLYFGRGQTASTADPRLRLSAPGCRKSVWGVPPWLKRSGLSFHADESRWLDGGLLRTAAIGQEFVAPIIDGEAQAWVDEIVGIVRK